MNALRKLFRAWRWWWRLHAPWVSRRRHAEVHARLDQAQAMLFRAELENKQLRKNAPDTSAPGMGEFHDHFGGN